MQWKENVIHKGRGRERDSSVIYSKFPFRFASMNFKNMKAVFDVFDGRVFPELWG
jgi:hypothetical protein